MADLFERIDEGHDALLAVLPFVDEAGTPAVVEGLLSRAFDVECGLERRAQLASLAAGLSRSDERTASLLQQLCDDNDDVRATAAMALGSRGNAAAIDALVVATADASPRVRDAAVRALCDIGGGEASAALAAVLEGSCLDEELLRVALHGLRGATREHVEPTLLSHVTHACADVRLAALSGLRDLRSLRETTAVRSLLTDADVRVRLLALSVLERHGRGSDGEAVQARLTDTDPRVRAMARDAVRALGCEARL